MFTHEEMLVLNEIGAGSLSDCKRALAENLPVADDQFTKDFLTQLMAKVEALPEREYRTAMKSGRRVLWRWWE
jgi:hypothetical protein